MPRLAQKLVLSLACVSLVAGACDAEAKTLYRKRVGFFESLFGIPQRTPPSRTIFGSDPAGGKLTWFEEQQLRKSKNRNRDSFYNDPSLQFYGDPLYVPKRSSRSNKITITKVDRPTTATVQTDTTEPEPLPGLGMGKLEYQPPLISGVFDSSFIRLTADNPEADAIRMALASNSTTVRAVEPERKAVLALYKTNNFKPLWTASGHVLPRAADLLKILANSSVDGLVSKNYMPSTLGSFENVEQTLGNDALKLANFDVDLTVQALKYARQLSGGQFEPNRLSLYNDIKPSPVNADEAVKAIADAPNLESYFASVAPANPQYAIFKSELAKLSAENSSTSTDFVADGPVVKPGKTDSRMPQIRARLQLLGLLTADAAVNTNEQLLDRPLVSALKAFQKSNKLKQTGSIDSNTVKAFNVDHRQDNRQRLIYNMERLRWLPKNLGDRYVLVNQAAFEVNVMDHGKSAWNSKVIVGRPLTQTYAFSDTMEAVVFNPTWGVPVSIIVNEYGPKSRKDASYLDRNGFKVFNAKGEEVSSKTIDWWAMGQAPNFAVQQPSGDGNALGEIKFLFPNSHDIYMHDTPTRNLFSESTRAFSHGCVRVQNPRNFAEVLLGWSQSEIEATISTKESLPVSMKQKLPVHLTYFTAWTDTDGKIRYFDDFYGRDDAIAKALAYDPTGKKPSGSDKIVQNSEISGGLIQN
jgi:L,D-transpeptidase YcbB